MATDMGTITPYFSQLHDRTSAPLESPSPINNPVPAHLPSHPTSIDHQTLPINIPARLLTRQKHARPLKILRPPPPLLRNPLHNLSTPILILHQRLIHIRRDIAGRNRIDRNPLRRPLVGKTLCNADDGVFRSGVCGDSDAALERKERGEVDDAAVRAVGDPFGGDGAAEGEYGGEVDL